MLFGALLLGLDQGHWDVQASGYNQREAARCEDTDNGPH